MRKMFWLSGTYSETRKRLYTCERKSTSMTVLVKFRQPGHIASLTASAGLRQSGEGAHLRQLTATGKQRENPNVNRE